MCESSEVCGGACRLAHAGKACYVSCAVAVSEDVRYKKALFADTALACGV